MISYKLPNNNVQISFSGGRTSAYMLYKILEANNGLPANVKVTFTNTGREMEQTLDFIQECSHRWNINIIWLEYDIIKTKNCFKIVNHNSASRNGKPFEILINKYGRLPNALQRFCTGVLKIQTASKYLKSLGWKHWHNALGIRYDEKHRVKTDLINSYYYGFYPLVNAKVLLNEIDAFWKKQPFNLSLPLVKGKSLKGNCDCCFLKSEHILAMMFKEHPEKAKWWVDIEKKYNKKFNRDRGLVEFSENINKQQDWVFEQQGYFCQSSAGECTG